LARASLGRWLGRPPSDGSLASATARQGRANVTYGANAIPKSWMGIEWVRTRPGPLAPWHHVVGSSRGTAEGRALLQICDDFPKVGATERHTVDGRQVHVGVRLDQVKRWLVENLRLTAFCPASEIQAPASGCRLA